MGVDLAPLAELQLEALDLEEVGEVDLAPLAGLRVLTQLSMSSLSDCQVPMTLELSPSLRLLIVDNERPGTAGDTVRKLIEAIDWTRLTDLRLLSLRVGDLDALAEPIKVDLGFLRELPRLEMLSVDSGVWHAGDRPSPLEPPFDGLATTLRALRIDAWEPSEFKPLLRQYLPGARIIVRRREPPGAGGRDWAIDRAGSDWTTYGSVFDAVDGTDGNRELATEREALEVARRKLAASDPALLDRLDFDQEADGTGITAPTREDLKRALQILGIH